MLTTRKTPNTSKHELPLRLVDFGTGGHHAPYIAAILSEWLKRPNSRRLQFLVSHALWVRVTGILKSRNLPPEAFQDSVIFAPTEVEPIFESGRRPEKARILIAQAKAAEKVFGIAETLFLYADTVLPAFATSMRGLSQVSGLIFRPRFHYHRLRPSARRPLKHVLADTAEEWVLNRFLSNPRCNRVISLDPFLSRYIRKTTKLSVSPDPILEFPIDQNKTAAIKQLVNPTGSRQVFLLLGELSQRKGVFATLEAFRMPVSSVQSACLCLIGPSLCEEDEKRIASLTHQLRCDQFKVHRDNRFIPEEEIGAWISASNVVLVPYHQHVGMSSILVRAARLSKPVIASSYGLIGEMCNRYQLGLICDGTPEALRAAIARWCNAPETITQVNFTAAQDFVAWNTPANFYDAIVNNPSQRVIDVAK